MENSIKVVICDDSKEMRSGMSEHLAKKNEIEIVSVLCDGKDAVSEVEKYDADVLVLDVFMPNVDGIGVLTGLKDCTKRPVVIMLMENINDTISRACIDLGADYFLIKPVDSELLYERIKLLCTKNKVKRQASVQYTNARPSERTLEISVTNTIHAVGVPANIKGYQYLRDAIIMSINDTELINAVTKQLYPLVAEKHKTSP